MTYNLTEIVGLCIAHNIDFEAVHGDNQNSFRTALLVNVGETIRVDFGSAARGQLVSRVHLASNHKVAVKIDDLIAAIKSYHNPNIWVNASSSAHGNTMPHASSDHIHNEIPAHVKVNGAGHLVFTGEIVRVTEFSAFVTFAMQCEEFYQNTVTDEIVASDPKYYYFTADKDENARIRLGATVTVTVQYVPMKSMVVKTLEIA